MTNTESLAARTQFCARVIGPLMLIVAVVLAVRAPALTLLVPAILQDGPLVFVTGLFTLIAGLVLLAAHHHWNGPTAVLVSLLGILTVLRGVLLLVAPEMLGSLAAGLIHEPLALWFGAAFAALLGGWLTFAGWIAARAEP